VRTIFLVTTCCADDKHPARGAGAETAFARRFGDGQPAPASAGATSHARADSITAPPRQVSPS